MIDRGLLKRTSMSLTYGVIVLVYLLAVISLLGFLRPLWLQQSALEDRIARERSQVEFLDQLVQQRPSVEAALKEQTNTVLMYERLIPASTELPEVLLVVKDLASALQAELIRLDYVPLRTQGSDAWYSMSIELRGSVGSVYGVVEALAGTFPTLYLHNITLATNESESVNLQANFDLYVTPPEWETSVSWEKRVWQELTLNLGDRFGVPLQSLQGFLARNLKVIGIVRVQGGENRALIGYNGTQEWKRIGDKVGPATIVEIGDTSIVFDVHGVKLNISFGGI